MDYSFFIEYLKQKQLLCRKNVVKYNKSVIRECFLAVNRMDKISVL